MTTRHPTLCAACKHFRTRKPDKPFTCAAFPGGIPQGIVLFGQDHRKPRSGDHGITFEQADGADAQYALDNWLIVHPEGGEGDGN